MLSSKNIQCLLTFFFLTSAVLSQNNDGAAYTYFKINSKSSPDKLFPKIESELGIKQTTSVYSIIVNISDRIAQNQYIEYSNGTIKKRFSWFDISEETQNAILALNSTYKENLSVSDNVKGEYYRILVKTSDDPVFVKIQKELMPGEPLLDTYTLVVNLSKLNPLYHYVAFGNDELPATKKYMWANLSMEVQKKLLEWNGENKVKIE